MKREDFEITDKQRKAYKDVAKAIKKAKKLGLVFFGKQSVLTAYPQKAFQLDLVAEIDDRNSESDRGNPVPDLGDHGLIIDSGADDQLYFKKGVFN